MPEPNGNDENMQTIDVNTLVFNFIFIKYSVPKIIDKGSSVMHCKPSLHFSWQKI